MSRDFIERWLQEFRAQITQNFIDTHEFMMNPPTHLRGICDMGLFGGAPSASPPPPPPPPPAPIQAANATSQVAGSAARSAAAAAQGQGFDNTITNTGGAAGQATVPTGQKTLLGQ